MAQAVRIPEQGSAVDSCVITGWLVDESDEVEAGQPLLEFETDKSTFELESPGAGTVLAVLQTEGAEVPIHALVAVIGDPGEDISQLVDDAEGFAHRSEDEAGAEQWSRSVPADDAAPIETIPDDAAAGPPSGSGGAPSEAVEDLSPGVLAVSPRAARLAAERGASLGGVSGSGPGGRIVAADVPSSAPPSVWAAGPLPAEDARGSERVPVSGVRKLTATRMQASLAESAQLTLTARADASRLKSMRARLKSSPPAQGMQDITITDLLLYVVARTLPDFPSMNAHFTWEEIEVFGSVHLGVAVQTDRGLLVPVIRHAERLPLRALSEECRRLAELARSGAAQPGDLRGATFTVTNLGMVGVDTFTPILDPPQVGILGVGAMAPVPTEVAHGIELRPGLPLSLTFDHRALDGYRAGQFLQAVSLGLADLDLTVMR